MTELKSSSSQKVLFLTLGIVLSYMLAREGIIHWIPRQTKIDGERYDLWMTLPRTLAFVACFFTAYFNGGLNRWGWHIKISWRGFVLLVLYATGFVAFYCSGHRLVAFSTV